MQTLFFDNDVDSLPTATDGVVAKKTLLGENTLTNLEMYILF